MVTENTVAICNHGYRGCTVFALIDKMDVPKFLEEHKEELEKKKSKVGYQSLTVLPYSELALRGNYKLDLIQ